MITYSDLQMAWLAFRREQGIRKARQLIIDHGGDGSLDSVPRSEWATLHAALTDNASLPATLDNIRRNAFARRVKRRATT